MSDSIQYHPEGVWAGTSKRLRDIVEDHYEEYHSWLQEEGKNPDRSIGYAPSSALVKLHRTTIFHRTVWNEIGENVLNLHPGHADWFVEALDGDLVRRQDGSRYKEGSKRKFVDAVRNDFEFRSRRSGVQRWEPDLSFSESNHRQADYFTLAEREDLFQASLRWEDLGKYSDLSPEERDRRKAYLAQKLKKPKEAIKPTDFQRIRTSWKIPSLVSVALHPLH
ncbi:hypothetical protein [Halobacterium zhouii]|uniref:hypothetical protein n=1 Tax=Halobacterium zhouii TaxID=2902624 RepID=UPI001E5A1A47|nr:hypothetical protein [Halobacterium zhouii]